MEDFDLITPLGIILGMAQLMIVGLSKLNDDEYYKFHQYDGWIGYAIIFIRMILFLYFVICLKESIGKSRVAVKKFI